MVANQLFYQVIDNKPELNVPNAIFRRLQLVWLCNILQGSLLNNDLGVLNDAYRILKAMEFPPDLEYSDEFLDLLVDFKTQLFIVNLLLESSVYTDALQSFARHLQITDRDEKEAQIINKKWMAKCIKRKKDIEFLASFDKIVQAWPESKFLERIKSLLMIIGAYLNQKYPASEIRRKLKNNALSVSNVEVTKSSDETSSVALTNDDEFVQVEVARKLPIGFSKSQPKSSHTVVNKHVDLLKADNSKVIINVDMSESDSTDALNEYTTNEEAKLSQIRPETVPISEYVTLFDSLKSLYSLDHADLSSYADGGTHNSNISNELISLKKKLEVVYDGYSTLQKHLNFLKDVQRKLENNLQPYGQTSNELPWTSSPVHDKEEDVDYSISRDHEEENLEHKDDSDEEIQITRSHYRWASNESAYTDEEIQITRSQQNATELEKLSEQDTEDGENYYKHLETQEYADEDNEIEGEELVLSDEEDELLDDDTESSSYRAHLTHRFMVSSSPSRSSRRTPQKTSDAETDSAKVQLAAYNGKDVYEIKCNNEFVLRRVSDGWVNASSIFKASSGDEIKNAMIEQELPGPKESVKGSKTSKLRGIWYSPLYST
jgi:hypothetical protein